MRELVLSLALLSIFAGRSYSASPDDALQFYDEEAKRYATLSKGDFGSTHITVRLAGDPGSLYEWRGQGQRRDKEMTFSRIVGEGENPGTYFNAKISDSKLEIDYKPQQKEPQDAGINGVYRRLNEAKMLQLAKKEFQAADERLQLSLKNATKTWDRKDRPALDLWKDQWPKLRQRWIDIGTVPGSTNTEKTAQDWVRVAQATARGYYFVETLPDAKTGLGWDGEYYDLGGGYASLRIGADGKLRLTLSTNRVEGQEAGTLEATATPEQLSEAKNGTLTAKFNVVDAEVKDAAKQAQVTLTKIGRYLHVETQNAERYAAKGWFDGIYRGYPVPPP